MRILIDTNRYRDFCSGLTDAVDRVQSGEDIFMAFVTLAELRAGFACGTKSRENERTLVHFLNSPRVKVLCADEDTTHHYASIFSFLRKQGTPVPTNDIWIAALAVQHDLPLYSRDAHFDLMPQVFRVE